jgi:hypothetical protein
MLTEEEEKFDKQFQPTVSKRGTKTNDTSQAGVPP